MKKETEKCQRVFCFYGVHVAEKANGIKYNYSHGGPGWLVRHRALITEESVAMTPRNVSIHAPVVCFFSLKLLILFRLDGIKYPPFVIRVFNEPISFNLQIPQQSSNQLCSSPKMDVVSPPPASHIQGCQSELLLGSAILQEGFFTFSPSSKCENVGNVLKNTRSQH